MTRIRDRIEQIERLLDKGDLSFLDRRILLRETFQAAVAEAFAEGHHEGVMDAGDARRAEETAASREASGA